MGRSRQIYRDGKVHVLREKCKTCIFRPGNLMHLDPGRVAQMVRGAVNANSCIVCHDTLGGKKAVCRGFFDAHKTEALGLAEEIGIIVEV